MLILGTDDELQESARLLVHHSAAGLFVVLLGVVFAVLRARFNVCVYLFLLTLLTPFPSLA